VEAGFTPDNLADRCRNWSLTVETPLLCSFSATLDLSQKRKTATSQFKNAVSGQIRPSLRQEVVIVRKITATGESGDYTTTSRIAPVTRGT